MKNKLIELLKSNGNRPVVFDSSMPIGVLLSYVIPAVLGLIRGLIRFRKVVVVGGNCTIQNRRYIQIGSGTVIKDSCVIDGWGKQGLNIGARCSIGIGSILRVSGSTAVCGYGIKLGKNVGLSDYCHVQGGGGVVIGDDTICGPYVSFHPENHGTEDIGTPIRKQTSNYKGISVGKNCWIGAKATLLDGCIIGDNCIVAAGSVVNKKFDDNLVIGGVPAKVLKHRAP